MIFDTPKAFREPFRVAMVAACRELRAASHRVPGLVRPFDLSCRSHYSTLEHNWNNGHTYLAADRASLSPQGGQTKRSLETDRPAAIRLIGVKSARTMAWESNLAIWRHKDQPKAGYVDLLSRAMQVVEERDCHLLWPVGDSRQVIVSDYSGQHRQATHEVYSFLVTTWEDLQHWLPFWQDFRANWLPDGRRLSFKQLREPLRKRAYPAFLAVAGLLRANLISIMIDNRVGSFAEGGPKVLAKDLDDCFAPKMSASTIEKVYRLSSFVAMLQSGLRQERQRSLWISDHDETLDSWDRRERFARLATYLTIGLTGWRNAADQDFMTTEANGLPAWVEDLAAIPDIAAGACAKLSGVLPEFIGQQRWTVRVSHREELDWRARTFADWLSTPGGVVRHVLLRLAPDCQGAVRASAQKFQRRGTYD